MADDNSFTLDPPVTASGSSLFLGCTFEARARFTRTPRSSRSSRQPDEPRQPGRRLPAGSMVGWRRPRSGRVPLARRRPDVEPELRRVQPVPPMTAIPDTPRRSHATDPWVSFDSAGRAYQISLTTRLGQPRILGCRGLDILRRRCDLGHARSADHRQQPDQLQRQGVDHRRLATGRWRGQGLRDLDPRRPAGWDNSARSARRTRSPTRVSRCSR